MMKGVSAFIVSSTAFHISAAWCLAVATAKGAAWTILRAVTFRVVSGHSDHSDLLMISTVECDKLPNGRSNDAKLVMLLSRTLRSRYWPCRIQAIIKTLSSKRPRACKKLSLAWAGCLRTG